MIDADLTGQLRERRLIFDFAVDSGSSVDALDFAFPAFRTALHAAGVATPGMDLNIGVEDAELAPC